MFAGLFTPILAKLPTPLLYELIFFTTVLLLAVGYGAAVALVRWLLRKWDGGGGAIFLAHLAGAIVLFGGAPLVGKLFPYSRFLGLTNFSLMMVCLTLLAADRVSAALARRRPASGSGRAVWVALVVATVAAGVLAVHLSAPAARGRAALEEARWAIPTFQALNRISPDGIIFQAMWKTFPNEARAMSTAYLEQVKAANPDGTLRTVPEFPRQPVRDLIRAHYADLARAPDADLARLARLSTPITGELASPEAGCRLVDGRPVMAPGFAAARASHAEVDRMGQVIAAALMAARAGIDHPVTRPITETRTQALLKRFAASLPPGTPLDLSSCVTLVAYQRWGANLSDADAAYMMAAQYRSALSGGA